MRTFSGVAFPTRQPACSSCTLSCTYPSPLRHVSAVQRPFAERMLPRLRPTCGQIWPDVSGVTRRRLGMQGALSARFWRVSALRRDIKQGQLRPTCHKSVAARHTVATHPLHLRHASGISGPHTRRGRGAPVRACEYLVNGAERRRKRNMPMYARPGVQPFGRAAASGYRSCCFPDA
jgi:hypothetical protein